jgi:hypothetical protein
VLRSRPPVVAQLALALLILLVGAAPAPAAARHRSAPRPAVFRVGAAVREIDPHVDVYAGGFGASPPIRRVAGQLQVRAFYVSAGHRAVAFAIVDSQAYFAAYQEGADYGISSVRQQAAAQISRLGVPMAASDIIVQGTHSHSAPTLEGIWGPVPPSYLKEVHDQAVAALVAAARAARPAWLQYGSADAAELDNSDTAQYDSFPGWSLDPQLSVLRAVAPRSGATIATFINVPAHPDIVCGACLKTLTADYPGAVRDALDRRLGGIALVTPATLGREESPVQATGIGEMQWFARVVSGLVGEALSGARWVTDPRLAGAESFAQIPGTNAALLALVAANHLPDAQKQQLLATTGQYPIDRQDTPPYLTGSVIGTPLTALRIGPLAYLSMPGEPFPEVRLTIAGAVKDAAMVVALSKGQDDLGYFFPSWVYPFTEVYPTDQGTFNVAPQAGDQIIQSQIANLRALGFTTAPLTVPVPLPTDYAAAARPGLQALASPPAGDVGRAGVLPVTLQAIYAPAEQGGEPLAGLLHWTFGDGTSGTSGALSFGGPCGGPTLDDTSVTNCPQTGPAYLVHDFPVGRHLVTVTGHDAAGHPVSFSLTVNVWPRLRVGWRIVSRHRGGFASLRAVPRGGSGQLLSASWRFPGGARATGLTVTHRFEPGRRIRATVTGTDTASTG